MNLYRSGKKDAELRVVMPQWKNSKPGDIATIQCGREILRRRIAKIHKGTLARIFKEIDYKRVFPKVSTIREAVRLVKELYSGKEEFMAFELEDIV